MAHVRPKDTIVVCWLDRFSRNFEEGVAIQHDLTKRDIGIISTEESINTADDSAAAKLFRRMMLAQGAYQVDSTSERIRAGIERARAEGKRPGRPPALTSEDTEDCRRLYAGGTGYSPTPDRQAEEGLQDYGQEGHRGRGRRNSFIG